jgi:MarR family transcriptional regulator, organic hydroperoxide resistance regulator
MVHVTSIIERQDESATAVDQVPQGEDLVELILGELEPVMALQRHAMAHVWHDRSISKANMHVLMLLDQLGPLPMGRLATLVDVSLPSLTGIVDRMAEHGLVNRGRDESDRRVVVIHVADKGRETLQELESVRRDLMRRVLRAMSPVDQTLCLGTVRTMHRIVDELEPDGHGAWPCARPDIHRTAITEPTTEG